MIKKLFVCLLPIFVSAPAHASFGDIMEETFGSMVNAGGPTGSFGEGRGVLTGGAVTIRNKVSTTPIISFVPPRAKAGCSGLNFIGGSFSIISKDEFLQLVRNIMSNAVGYFLQLGIESICPSCMAVMRSLQAKIDDVNNMFSNSCEMAKTMVDSTGIKETFSGWGAMTDQYLEPFVTNKEDAAVDRTTDGKDAADIVAENDPELAENMWNKNIVWYAMNAANVADEINALWSDSQKTEFLEQMMSLYGTVITRLDTDSDPAAKSIEYIKPTLSVRDLIEGGIAGRSNQGAGSNGVSADVPNQYRCSHDPEEANNCIEVAEIESSIAGMAERLHYLMTGYEPYVVRAGITTLAALGLDQTPGIIYKMRNNEQLNAQEKEFANLNPFSAFTILLDFARHSDAADNIAPTLSTLAATSTVAHIVEDINLTVLSAVRSIAAEEGNEEVEAMLSRMQDIRKELIEVKNDADQQISMLANTYSTWQTMLQSTRGRGRGQSTH